MFRGLEAKDGENSFPTKQAGRALAMRRSTAGSAFEHFRAYSGRNADEAIGAQGTATGGYGAVVDVLCRCSPAELRRRQARLDRAAAEMGSDAGTEAPWRLDLFPRLFREGEWASLAAGVLQRARALNQYVTDLYGEQNILRERVVPCETALRDPRFHRQFSGIAPTVAGPCVFGAFDLVRTADGEWLVSDHHLGTTYGVSYVLQNRRMLAQLFPELFETMAVAPVASFSTLLLEALREQSEKENPHVLLLTRGEAGPVAFEDGFLARHMGISMAHPGDLLVRDRAVFLKTIHGLERVDTIFRRVDCSTVDPVSVPHPSFSGVPGLVNVVREGNVAMANGLGSGVADNRAILRYMDRIVGFYLHERPILKTVDTYYLGDRDQRDFVFGSLDQMRLRPLQEAPSGERAWDDRRLEREARRCPEQFVAQTVGPLSSLPSWRAKGGFAPVEASLRVFFILGKNPAVMPGGLTRVTGLEGAKRGSGLLAGGVKDTWIPVAAATAKAAMPVGGLTERFSIGSRMAEALYWSGRYLERAETTARHLHILENLRWDQLGRAEQRTYWPLLQAIAAATGQTGLADRRQPPGDTLAISAGLLLDAAEPASVHACVLAARRNLEGVRDVVSPECWQALEELAVRLRQAARRRSGRAVVREASLAAVNDIARFHGLFHRTMSHDDGWHFYQAGLALERSAGGVGLLAVALPRACETFRAADQESADLMALLRLFASLDAYRREYRSRAYLDRVAGLLLVNRTNPSSLHFSLRSLRQSLAQVVRPGGAAARVLREVEALIAAVEALPLADLLPPAVPHLDAGEGAAAEIKLAPERVAAEMRGLADRVQLLHERIEDVFFSHQHMFAREATLFDL